MSSVAGRDLSWFWTTWFYEPWSLQQTVASVGTQGDSTAITIEDRGLAPMPVALVVTRVDGSVQRVELPVDIWLSGERQHVVRIASIPRITRVEIDPDGLFPEMNRTETVWPRAPGA